MFYLGNVCFTNRIRINVNKSHKEVVIMRKNSFIIMYTIMLISLLYPSMAYTNTDSHTVVFPDDRSLGRLFVIDSNTIDSVYWWWRIFTDWQYIGEATGKIVVPAGKKLALDVSRDGEKDLSPLAELKPADIDTLVIRYEDDDVISSGDKSLSYICKLAGLKTLILEYAGISNNGLKSLKDIPSLVRLSFISKELDDSGLANIAEIKSLEGLRFYGPKVTNDGIANLTKLSRLEELLPNPKLVDDESIAIFAKIPRLKYLVLLSPQVSEQGYAPLQDLTSLKKVELSRPPVSEGLMEGMSKLISLEELSIQNTIIDDELIALFNPPYLKKLKLQRAFQQIGNNFTDKGLEHLAQFKSIESLELFYGNFTDKGLESLSQLPNLRTLIIPNSHGFTDEGVEHLTLLKNLESLFLRGEQLTDDGMAVIGQLKNLKELRFLNCPLITNQGIARLSGLKSLKKLEFLMVPKVTNAGLNQLNFLSELIELRIRSMGSDGSILHIEGLTRLEQLRLPVFQDDDLDCIAKLQNIRSLEITNRGELTDEGQAYLKKLTSDKAPNRF